MHLYDHLTSDTFAIEVQRAFKHLEDERQDIQRDKNYHLKSIARREKRLEAPSAFLSKFMGTIEAETGYDDFPKLKSVIDDQEDI